MKMYRKPISMALACVMLLSAMATTALADPVSPAEEANRKGEDLDPTTASNTASIDVLAFQDELVVYAVDVEWGEMTFQYVPGTWNPETMKLDTEGANAPRWLVYNNTSGKAIEAAEDAPTGTGFAETAAENSINAIKVSNRSNAPVSATLAFATAGAFGVDAGTYTKGEATNTTTVNYKADNSAFLLAKATPGDGSNGTAAAGIVYFKPTVPANTESLEANLAHFATKFDKIGTITVTVATSETAPQDGQAYSPA